MYTMKEKSCCSDTTQEMVPYMAVLPPVMRISQQAEEECCKVARSRVVGGS